MSRSTPTVRMLRGDEAQLYREHQAALERSVHRAVNAPQACIDDACSFAWLQLLRLQPNRDTVFGWLRTVAIHEAWRLAARERRDAHLELVPAWDERCGAPELDRSVGAHEALAALACLPERQSRYLALLVAGYSYREIARLCDATLTNVNKHLVRARSALRRTATDLD